jgi:hypothetical protein
MLFPLGIVSVRLPVQELWVRKGDADPTSLWGSGESDFHEHFKMTNSDSKLRDESESEGILSDRLPVQELWVGKGDFADLSAVNSDKMT